MSIATLRQYVEELPERTTLEKRAVLELIERHADAEGGLDWVDTKRAHEITGVPPRTLRGKAMRWLRTQEHGGRPAVRVYKTSDAAGAHWRFCLSDCFRWRREHGGGPRRVERTGTDDAGALDEREATLQKYRDEVDRTW